MKYRLLLLSFFGLNLLLHAQTINVTSAGVGIGTTTPNARLDLGVGYGTNGEKLIVYNDNPSSALARTKSGFYLDRFGNNNTTFVFPTAAAHPGTYVFASKDTADTALIPRMTIQGQSGNVGIGTLTPAARLMIVSDNPPNLYISGTSGNYIGLKIENHNYSSGNNWVIANDSLGGLSFNHNGTDKVWIDRMDSGNMIINLGNVTVSGDMRATRFVSNNQTYADFVLKSDYKLPTLAEVEAHIKKNGHLQGIPSESEAMKNGMDLADMQVRLLAKIEELTLHMIAHEKAIEVLREENSQLKAGLKLVIDVQH